MTSKLLQISQYSLIASGLYGLTGIMLGAMGAHALHERLSESGGLDAWKTASSYQIFMALGLLGLSLLIAQRGPSNLLHGAVLCWIVGTFMFSGSIYWLVLDGPRWLGPVTPIGGSLLILGWALLLVFAFRRNSKP